jgi:hypothetical protein
MAPDPNKRALVIGIDYVGQDAELTGCVRDADDTAAFLADHDYQVVRLVDRGNDDVMRQPTRRIILRELMALVSSPARKLYLHYSGHGTHIHDSGTDERDDRDEALCPVDMNDAGYITDDAIRGVLASLRKNQTLSCVLDCCHSGSGMDLRHKLFDRGETDFQYFTDNHAQPTPGQVLMLSGCRDDQYSEEVTIEGEFRGVMTTAILEFLRANARATAITLVRQVREKTRRDKHRQIAQLSSGKSRSLRRRFMP